MCKNNVRDSIHFVISCIFFFSCKYKDIKSNAQIKLETLFELYSCNFDLKTVHVPLKDEKGSIYLLIFANNSITLKY